MPRSQGSDMCAHFMPPLGNRSIIASGFSSLLSPGVVLPPARRTTQVRKAFYKFHASDYASYQSLQPGAVAADPWAAVTRSTKRNPICVINGMRLARCLPLSHALFSASPFCALQVLRQTNNSALKSFVHFMPCRTQHPIRQLRANLCPPRRSPRRVPLATGLCFLPHFNCNALNCGRRSCELYRQN